MTAALFIVTHGPHFPFFQLCAESIAKNVSGFSQVVVVVPTRDVEQFACVNQMRTADGVGFTLRHHYEASDRGHIWMNATKCCADLYCSEAELIVHLDADCVVTKPTTPESYLRDGMIVMLVRPYEVAGDARAWKPLVDRSLGMDAKLETMQSPQLAYWRQLYGLVRGRIEEIHEEPFFHCALTNHVPDFPALGAWALKVAPLNYLAVLRDSPEGDAVPRFIEQGWSHHVHNPNTLPSELARLRALI